MQNILNELLTAAEANLARYIEAGDENAIRAGQNMVDSIRADLAAL